MNETSQRRNIKRYLKGKITSEIDAFCIYQWIERCHIQEWWEMAIKLASYITPGSLNTHYQKRLDFILKDCRIKQDILNGGKSLVDPIIPRGVTPRHPIRRYIRKPGFFTSGADLFIEDLSFDNDAKQTLREIYAVLYYLGNGYDFVDAVHHTKNKFNITYQTVDDKCARRFAVTVEIFQRWFRNGEILQRLRDHFHLSYRDYKIFEELLTKK